MTIAAHAVRRLGGALTHELQHRMLPYWVAHAVDHEHGGFRGRVRRDGEPVRGAPKGCVLNARILWTFAAAYRRLGTAKHRELADRAYSFLTSRFWDPAHGGVFWTVDAAGTALETRKQTYAQAFAVYGLAEYHRATDDPTALEWAVRLYRLIETHARDEHHGGYVEALGSAWQAIPDVRLSDKDLNAPKSMNTHLHVLEAYTNLYRVWPDAALRQTLASLVGLFEERILDARTHHLGLFFDAGWTPVSTAMSFGHDIEASWLLLEAADALEDRRGRSAVHDAAVALARTVLEEGIDASGGLVNEVHPDGAMDGDKYWWAQFEAVVGFLSAYQETGSAEFLHAAVAIWEWARAHLADREHGEWYFRVRRDGRPYLEDDKVGMWKCPYHGVRACLQVIERAERAGQG